MGEQHKKETRAGSGESPQPYASTNHIKSSASDYAAAHPYVNDPYIIIERNGLAVVASPQAIKIQDLDSSASPDKIDVGQHIDEKLQECLADRDCAAELKKTRVLVLDLSKTEFMGSQFLGVLTELKKQLHQKGIKLMLAGVKPQPLEVLKITHLDKFFGEDNIHLTMDSACQALQNPKPGISV